MIPMDFYSEWMQAKRQSVQVRVGIMCRQKILEPEQSARGGLSPVKFHLDEQDVVESVSLGAQLLKGGHALWAPSLAAARAEPVGAARAAVDHFELDVVGLLRRLCKIDKAITVYQGKEKMGKGKRS